MNTQAAIGVGLCSSGLAINAVANAIGIAKTGTAIGSLSGAAQTSAIAAWVGFGSMKVGLFAMGALPVIGGLILLDSLCGSEYGTLIDWYEEGWKDFEAQCEMEELKKTVKVDPDHRIIIKKRPSSLAQQERMFALMEADHELYLMRKEMGLI